jgi:hypothetical protein
MEAWLALKLTMEDLGHFLVEGRVANPAFGQYLDFRFSSDLTFMRMTLAGLDAVLTNFPVRGSPETG